MKDKFDMFFERLKEINFSENTLCKEFWLKLKSLHQNFDESACWDLLVSNIEWVINTGSLTTDELTSWFSPQDLAKHNIFSNGVIEINSGLAIGIGKAKIKATGHSRVILFDKAECEAFDTTFVSGFNESTIVLKNCNADAFHNCKVTAKDFSKVEAWGDSKIKAETYSCVLAHENALVENSGNGYTIIV